MFAASCDQLPVLLHSVPVQHHQHSGRIPWHHLRLLYPPTEVQQSILELLIPATQIFFSFMSNEQPVPGQNGSWSAHTVLYDDELTHVWCSMCLRKADRRSDSPIPSATPLTRSGSVSKKASLLKTSSVRVQVITRVWNAVFQEMRYTTHAFSSLVTENADNLAAQEIGTTEVTSWQEQRHYGWWAYPKEGQEVPQVHPQQAQIQKRWAAAQLFRWLLSLYYQIRWQHYLCILQQQCFQTKWYMYMSSI